jgi:hypothetical protein
VGTKAIKLVNQTGDGFEEVVVLADEPDAD